MNEIQKQKNTVVDLAELAIVTMICIVVVHQVAVQLIGEVPANVGAVILAIAATFTFAVSKNARITMLSWVRKARKRK